MSKAFEVTRRRLVICQIDNDIDGISGYLALLLSNAVVMMVSTKMTEHDLSTLVKAYSPDFVWLQGASTGSLPKSECSFVLGKYELLCLNPDMGATDLRDDLALLLSTSGSTGSAKHVRLSHQNVWSNAASIAEYLQLTSNELPITALPPSYSYGLSVIHSHIWVGAALAVCNKTLFDRDFWGFLRDSGATSFSGVPYHYEILKKLRFVKMKLPYLRTLTQAGGRMDPDLTREFASHCQINGMRFFTMYGQTEASPRMAYVPAEQALAKAGSIGISIPGGELQLQFESGYVLTEPNITGELVYRGPNVCLGYADRRSDLSLGDTNGGVLHTGDLAERDEDGYFRIVGRKKRLIKLFGNRVSLDDVEGQLATLGLDAACLGRDDLLEVYLASMDKSQALEIKRTLMERLRIGVHAVAVFGVGSLPRSETGKLLYAELHPDKGRLLT